MNHIETLKRWRIALQVAENIHLVGAAYTVKAIGHGIHKIKDAGAELDQAIEQAEQEPVAMPRFGLNPDNGMMYESERGPWCLYKDVPPQRQPLTPEQIKKGFKAQNEQCSLLPRIEAFTAGVKFSEAAHGIKV